MPLSILFQSFTTPVRRLGVQETHVFATFNNVSVIYHSINVGRGLEADVLCLFQ
jgi:hypothetical protein